MSARRFAIATVWLAAGALVPAAAFWGLLNVPESSVAALSLSAILALVTVAAVGLVASGAASVLDDRDRPLLRATRSLVPYAVALVICAVLWWVTTAVDGWWQLHGGEIDALALRYLAATRTKWVHASLFSATWALRWVFGVAVVAALVTAGTIEGATAVRAGLRASTRPLTLVACAGAILALRYGLWRLVYWRPRRLPLNAEPFFVSAKLLALYLVSAAIVALLLGAVVRAFRPRAT